MERQGKCHWLKVWLENMPFHIARSHFFTPPRLRPHVYWKYICDNISGDDLDKEQRGTVKSTLQRQLKFLFERKSKKNPPQIWQPK